MSADKLKKLIISLTQDIEFEYNGIKGAICPFSHSSFSVSFGDEEKAYNNIDDVMKTTIIGGEPLEKIAHKLII